MSESLAKTRQYINTKGFEFQLGNLISASWELTKHVGLWLPGMMLLSIVIDAGISQFTEIPNVETDHWREILSATLPTTPWEVVHIIVSALVWVAAMTYGIKVIDGKPTSAMESAGKSLRLLPQSSLLFVMKGALVGIGTMALILPGLYFQAAFFLTTPLLISERTGPFRAFSRSKELMVNYKMPIIKLYLKFVFVILLLALMFVPWAVAYDVKTNDITGFVKSIPYAYWIIWLLHAYFQAMSAMALVICYKRIHNRNAPLIDEFDSSILP